MHALPTIVLSLIMPWFPAVELVDVPRHIRHEHRDRVHQHATRLSTDNTPCDNGRTTYRELWRFAWVDEPFNDARSRIRFSLPPIWIGAFMKRREANVLVGIDSLHDRHHLSQFGPGVTLVWCHEHAFSLTMKTQCGSSVRILLDMEIMVNALNALTVKIVRRGV
jgi:hypothetical protein